jgi:hypothetical protein
MCKSTSDVIKQTWKLDSDGSNHFKLTIHCSTCSATSFLIDNPDRLSSRRWNIYNRT